jgi:hypothetical protein
LVDTLKRALRQHHVTYKDIAKALELSEASVKRMFSHGHFTLERVEAICALINWDWIDLAEATRLREKKIDSLSLDQEKEIAEDIELLMVAVSVINGFSFEDILSHYHMPANTCIQKLAKLDRLKLIDLLPGNRMKLKISPHFHWQPDGPIQQYFLNAVVKEFFNTNFTDEYEKLVVVNAMLSDHAHKIIQTKMERLAAEMTQAMQQDAHLSKEEKKGSTLVMALRHWRYQTFDAMYAD